MAKKNAVLFNGAASLIAQEVGMFDLLTEIEGLTINQDDTFIGGFSSGGLMAFAMNATHSNTPPISWSYFKEDILFPLKTSDVYLPNGIPFDTSPLRELITKVVHDDTGYDTVSHLPFPSAILTMSLSAFTTCWMDGTLRKLVVRWSTCALAAASWRFTVS